MNKRQAQKRLDELSRAYERHYRSNQRHSASQIQKLLKGEDTTKVEFLRDQARARLDETVRKGSASSVGRQISRRQPTS